MGFRHLTENYRESEVIWGGYWVPGGDDDAHHSYAGLVTRRLARIAAGLNIARTFFICAVLMLGSQQLSRDADRFVTRPLAHVIAAVTRMADNPLLTGLRGLRDVSQIAKGGMKSVATAPTLALPLPPRWRRLLLHLFPRARFLLFSRCPPRGRMCVRALVLCLNLFMTDSAARVRRPTRSRTGSKDGTRGSRRRPRRRTPPPSRRPSSRPACGRSARCSPRASARPAPRSPRRTSVSAAALSSTRRPAAAPSPSSPSSASSGSGSSPGASGSRSCRWRTPSPSRCTSPRRSPAAAPTASWVATSSSSGGSPRGLTRRTSISAWPSGRPSPA